MHIYAQIQAYMHRYTYIFTDIALIHTDTHIYVPYINDMDRYTHIDRYLHIDGYTRYSQIQTCKQIYTYRQI